MQPTTRQPASVEPYGGVPKVRRRDPAGDGSLDSGNATSLYLASTGYDHTHGAPTHVTAPLPTGTQSPDHGSLNGGSKKLKYEHNGVTAGLILPSLVSLLVLHPNPYPLIALLFGALILYALDLANSRDGTALGIWVSFAGASTSFLSGVWEEVAAFSGSWSFVMVKTAASVMLLFSLACWSTLQMKWLHHDTASFAVTMERMLHAILPLASAAVMTYSATLIVSVIFGLEEIGASTFPLFFATWFAIGIAAHGTCGSSFMFSQAQQDTTTDGDAREKSSGAPHAITTSDGWCLSFLLVLLPPLAHLVTFRHRILHAYASWDDWFELMLILTVPYMLHYIMLLLDIIWWKNSLPLVLRTGTKNTLRGAFVPIVLSLVSSIALQQRYLVPICHSVSFLFNGHESQSSVLTSVYLTISTCALVAALWFFQRKNQDGEFLFGDYHEDVFQLILAISGACFGLGFGLPLKVVPLPTLMLLGFAIYLSTRMLRFFAVILFTVFVSLSFLIQYRFFYIPKTVDLVPNFGVTLTWFAWIISCVGLLIVTVVGLVLRSPDGYGTPFLRKIDLAGVLTCSYAAFLGVVEAIMMKEPIAVPHAENNVGKAGSGGVYEPYMSLVTGFLLIIISLHLRKTKCIKAGTAMVAASLCLGKILVIVTDSAGGGGGGTSTWNIILKETIASLLLIVSFSPYIFLEPIHTKSRSKRSLGPSGKPADSLPRRAQATVSTYCGLVLPAVIAMSVPTVIRPLIGLIRGYGAYYNAPPNISELAGVASSFWGLGVLSMLNHFLPDGGADVWRKTSALAFLLGLGVFFASPTLPGASSFVEPSSAFASISSIGEGVVSGKNGGWGLVAASLATLLALTGPLELRERKAGSGSKDQLLLLRLMLFSILFGCGVAWFIVMQNMSEEAFVPLFLTSTSCMVMAFFGTIASALGYFLEVQEFEEAQQIAKIWMFSFPLFLAFSGVSMISSDASSPFSAGGWLSTYLIVCSLCTLAFAAAVKCRRERSAATRGLGNLSSLASWTFAMLVVYGQFGLASIGVPSGIVLGCPVSIIGTFLASLILLLLEGETAERSTRTYSLSSQRKQVPVVGVCLPKLAKASRFAPTISGMVSMLLLGSLYTILLRGCWLVQVVSTFGGEVDVHKSHEDVFASIYGKMSRTTGVREEEDVATMAQKNLAHSDAVITAAKLAGSGFWTANTIFGPLLHLAGTLAVFPSLFYLMSFLWTGTKYPTSKITALLPLNLAPLILCKGIPSLWAVAIIALVGGGMQAVSTRRIEHASRMRI